MRLGMGLGRTLWITLLCKGILTPPLVIQLGNVDQLNKYFVTFISYNNVNN
jgi:hypothetical protein